MEAEWVRLGTLVKERRQGELGLTQSQVQERGGPSPALIRQLEAGRSRSMSRSKRRDLERALEWRAGSIDDILDGGQPAPASEPVDIPNIRHHPDEAGSGGGKYEITRDMGSFEPIKLFGLVLLADQLASAADDFTKDDGSPDRLVSLAHKTYHASIQILAESMGVDVVEARNTVHRLGYMFEDFASPDGSAAK